MEDEKRIYAASSLGHFPRQATSRIMEINTTSLPRKRRMLMFNETDLANGSKKNGELYEKTVSQESSVLQHDLPMWRKRDQGKMVLEEKHVNKFHEMGPQTPSPSKWKSKNDVLACYTRRKRLNLDDGTLLSSSRRLMSNETKMANLEFKETFQGHLDKDGRENNMIILGLETNGKHYEQKVSNKDGGQSVTMEEQQGVKGVNKIEVVGPHTPSPPKRKGISSPINNGITACTKEQPDENASTYLSNKVEKAYYNTRSLTKLVINELTLGQEASNQLRTDTHHHPNPIGQLMGNRRVSLKGLNKKENKKTKFILNVEREVTKKWYVLLGSKDTAAVSKDNTGGSKDKTAVSFGVLWDKVDGICAEVLFIIEVGSVQGSRVYLPWDGSVLDSVAGTFLTQRVADNISSSAFMSLRKKFPQDPALYSRHHHSILKKKKSNASCSNVHFTHKTGNMSNFGKQKSMHFDGRKSKKGKIPKKKGKSDWKKLREDCFGGGGDADNVDSVDWHAVMQSSVDDIAKLIVTRGMNKKLATRIKDFLDRLVSDHGDLNLEWLRNAKPQDAKNFLLSINGFGLKSTECVRLLTLRQPAFPVDVNVARVTVRLGWVPSPSISDDILMSLLEQNSKLRNLIQEYLWPRLSKLDKDTLYQLHCHMITFGKVFCTSQKPNCAPCPLRSRCIYYNNLAHSTPPCFEDKDIEEMGNSRRTVTRVERSVEAALSERTKSKVKEAARQSGGSKTRTRTRTVQCIYELPDLHPYLETFGDRDPDDPSPYLLVTWEKDLTKPANKSPSANCVRGPPSILGTIMIPCRTALKGNFPLNGTYFQPNEVFADLRTSQIPINIPLEMLQGLPRKQLYCGSNLTSIVRGCSANDIHRLFHEGYICTRSFDRETYATSALDGQLHKSTTAKKTSFKK